MKTRKVLVDGEGKAEYWAVQIGTGAYRELIRVEPVEISTQRCGKWVHESWLTDVAS